MLGMHKELSVSKWEKCFCKCFTVCSTVLSVQRNFVSHSVLYSGAYLSDIYLTCPADRL